MSLTIKKCIKVSLISTKKNERKCFIWFEELIGIFELDIPELPKGTKISIENNKIEIIEAKGSPNKEELQSLLQFYEKVKTFLSYKDIQIIWEHTKSNCYLLYNMNPYFMLNNLYIPQSIQNNYSFTYQDLIKNIIPTTFKIRREEIGLCFVEELKKIESTGNTYCEYGILEKKVKNALLLAKHPLLSQERDLTPFLNNKIKDGTLYCDINNFTKKTPIFRRKLYEIEESIYIEVKELLSNKNVLSNISYIYNDNLSEEQNIAVDSIFKSIGNSNIITGGPGTGKTSIINEIIKVVMESKKDSKIKIVAPTGRASKVVEEATEYRNENIEISTAHKFIGYNNPNKEESNKVKDYNLIIIDESSMISPTIFEDLLSKMNRETTKLILVGDVDQLPSIEPGDILNDLILLGVPVKYLSNNYRSNEIIIENSKKINKGIEDLKYDDTFQLIDTTNMSFEEINKKIVEEAMSYINNDINNISIITPYITENIMYSSSHLNQMMHKLYHKKNPNIQSYARYYYNEPVILNKTNYRSCFPYFNGEVGRLIDYKVSGSYIEYEIDLGDRTIFAPANHVELAYSITVHKSQGSGYDNIIIVLPEYNAQFITKELLYTAITRAKTKVSIYSNKKIIKKIIKNTIQNQRKTLLKTKEKFINI